MRKIMIMMVAALALTLNCTTAQAQNSILEKQLKKEYKVKMKQFKKEKWQIYASSRSLEVALLSHYDKLAKGGDNAFEIVGIASKFRSKNTGHQTAINLQHLCTPGWQQHTGKNRERHRRQRQSGERQLLCSLPDPGGKGNQG